MPAPKKNLNNNKYKPEYARQVHKLCLMGARDKELADFFEVHRDTIFHWCKLYPEFSLARRTGKMMADAEVAHALYKRAVGTAVRKQRVTSKGLVVEIKEELPADVRAMEFWLKCRKRHDWNPKHNVHLSGVHQPPLAFLLGDTNSV